jgi:hypothetical protein
MNTIKDLAMQWSTNLLPANKDYLMSVHHNHSGRDFSDLTGREIEDIFYNEVIVKWWDKQPNQGELHNHSWSPSVEEIKEIYLKENTKEQPKAIEDNVWDEARKEYFKYVSECRINGVTYLDLFKWLEQHYSLIKK